MKFVQEVAPELTHNALFKGSGGEYRDAAYMQTPREHEEAIEKFTKERERQFIRAGMSPAQVALGKRRAKAWAENYDEPTKVEKYWNGDQEPRRPIQTSSSWIGEVRIVPSLGLARLNLNGRNYSYSLTPDMVGDMVTSESLGQFYNGNIKSHTGLFTKSKKLGW
ncbi:MAG: hypothetical protein J6T54_12455 [Fibrobacter sp.]|nr:hypothetical protein [Fibrobacter sp.]